ncbi:MULTISPECIES: type VI secretion system contractile sheath small subunit [Escherichia]|uniref:Type VI secretion system contractile sheath small subunit n=1 Tax=Escherichia coli TaxID=562 RepID=A0A0L6ZFW8_ECOLX|nr:MULTISPECIES: type VI secretion system contractile sheath small subunit [Escherichia]EEX5266463.1 type VI secretion system contractile sheath small subunit [Escherichia coli O157]EJE7372200.1 type VI secretion system contractile sheath small subunit [Shigella dysenteriae]HDQ6586854.1 type VI secretion system contractile sheath small subunit [Escherichia coli O187:H28]EEC8626952.1 type VI secretion system contractile sheath small subunit [Escherichia coli]EER1412141.1 type VI secretion syste
MSNTQHKLDKSRPPRVQITYDVETGDAETAKELPLVIGVLGEYSSSDKPLRERKFICIDKDNFDEVMTSMSPKAHFMVNSVIPGNEGKLDVELTFKCKDDFSPDHVIQQVECLKKLSELRSHLCDLRNRAASNEKLKEKLQELLVNTQNNPENDEGKE